MTHGVLFCSSMQGQLLGPLSGIRTYVHSALSNYRLTLFATFSLASFLHSMLDHDMVENDYSPLVENDYSPLLER